MTLVKWEPFRLGSFRSEMDRLVDHFLGHDTRPRDGWFRPALEVAEDEGMMTVKAELPGVAKDKVDVKIDGRVLTISGTKEEKQEKDEKTYHIYEASYGSFQRSLELPDYVDTEKVGADYADGVLTISLPKKEEAKPRQLKIDVK